MKKVIFLTLCLLISGTLLAKAATQAPLQFKCPSPYALTALNPLSIGNSNTPVSKCCMAPGYDNSNPCAPYTVMATALTGYKVCCKL